MKLYLPPQFKPTLPIYPAKAANSLGYLSITTTVRPDLEGPIMESMENSMRGADAIWIDYSTDKLAIYQLGRHNTELKLNFHAK